MLIFNAVLSDVGSRVVINSNKEFAQNKKLLKFLFCQKKLQPKEEIVLVNFENNYKTREQKKFQ